MLANRPATLFSKHFEYNTTTLLFSTYGDHWRNIRRIGIVENAEGCYFVKVELRSILYELTFNNIMTMVAGKRYAGDKVANKEEGKEFIEIMDEAFSSASEGRNTMIDHLLSRQESQPEYYSDEIIKGLIQSILIAGTDTSAVTLEWAMSNLLNHPDVLKKARAELDAQIGQERLVEESDLSKLNYLHSIISETLRLYPATPMLLPHFASDDCIVSGFDIPSDTLILVNAWAIHRDPTLWNDESFKPVANPAQPPAVHSLSPSSHMKRLTLCCFAPLPARLLLQFSYSAAPPVLLLGCSSACCSAASAPRLLLSCLLASCSASNGPAHVRFSSWIRHCFKPERFVMGGNKDEAHKFIPFGMGRRACPGAGLAQREVGLTLASLIQCFEWKRVSDKEVDMTEGKGLTMPKLVPLEAMCKPRSCFNKLSH
ncbi:hypothetical protein ACLB2K_004232 [Fragaria x ananassa]